jgi:hypothetical protein
MMTNKSSAAKQRYADRCSSCERRGHNLESTPSGRFIATVLNAIGNMIGEVEERLEFDECWNVRRRRGNEG